MWRRHGGGAVETLSIARPLIEQISEVHAVFLAGFSQRWAEVPMTVWLLPIAETGSLNLKHSGETIESLALGLCCFLTELLHES
jgi:hypothetical protein